MKPKIINKTAYLPIDYDEYVNFGNIEPIGEPILGTTIEKEVPRGKFEITYTTELFNTLQKLGNKKIEVFNYILANKDGNNCLNITNTQLAERSGISRKTVVETMKILSDAGIVARENSLLMLSPKLMVKGNKQRAGYLIQKFIEVSQNAITTKEKAINAIVDEQLEFMKNGEVVERARNE